MPIFAKSGTEGVTFAKFVDSLLSILGGKSFKEVIKAIASAYPEKRPVASAMGAHMIKCGLSAIGIDLIKRDIVSTIALNGARAIHDFQVALIRETSENVTTGLERT